MEEGRDPRLCRPNLRDRHTLYVPPSLSFPFTHNQSTAMFGVPKYSAALEKLRLKRNVSGLFSHNLISIDNSNNLATFSKPDGTQVVECFDLLHVVPPQGPLAFIKNSPLGSAPLSSHTPSTDEIE